MRAFLVPVALGLFTAPGYAQSLEVIGYSGYLGEWELTALVTESTFGRTRKYSGPLTMKHVGLCTQDGPEERTGEIQFDISAASSRLDAKLAIAGIACTYSGRLSDSYSGILICPDREAVPLKLWLK